MKKRYYLASFWSSLVVYIQYKTQIKNNQVLNFKKLVDLTSLKTKYFIFSGGFALIIRLNAQNTSNN